jgi:hypothetical protein
MRGADAFVVASSLAEARAKAESGDWEELNTHVAETVDWAIESVEENT